MLQTFDGNAAVIIHTEGTVQLVPEAERLLNLYNEGITLYRSRKFAEGLAKFDAILKIYPEDGPSKLYRQRCEVLKDFPPKDDWDGVFKMGSK